MQECLKKLYLLNCSGFSSVLPKKMINIVDQYVYFFFLVKKLYYTHQNYQSTTKPKTGYDIYRL